MFGFSLNFLIALPVTLNVLKNVLLFVYTGAVLPQAPG